jgi:hypothetical protein
MYTWKCWRDTRSRFIISLIIVAVVCFAFAAISARQGSLILGPNGRQVEALGMQGILCLIMLIAALTLGGKTIGNEFKEQTSGFLLTRPRRRRYWVWTCWAVGVCELSGVVLFGVAGSFAGLSFLFGHVYTWRWFATSLFMLVGAVAVYSLAYFLTVLARSGEPGVTGGVIFVIIDTMLLPSAFLFWHVRTFLSVSVLNLMMAGGEWATSHNMTFPLGKLLLWTLFALAFPLAAQLLLERAEA